MTLDLRVITLNQQIIELQNQNSQLNSNITELENQLVRTSHAPSPIKLRSELLQIQSLTNSSGLLTVYVQNVGDTCATLTLLLILFM